MSETDYMVRPPPKVIMTLNEFEKRYFPQQWALDQAKKEIERYLKKVTYY